MSTTQTPTVLLLRTGRGQRIDAELQAICANHGLTGNVPFQYLSDPVDVADFDQSNDPKPKLVIATGTLKAHAPAGQHVDARGWIKGLARKWGAELVFVSDD